MFVRGSCQGQKPVLLADYQRHIEAVPPYVMQTFALENTKRACQRRLSDVRGGGRKLSAPQTFGAIFRLVCQVAASCGRSLMFVFPKTFQAIPPAMPPMMEGTIQANPVAASGIAW